MPHDAMSTPVASAASAQQLAAAACLRRWLAANNTEAPLNESGAAGLLLMCAGEQARAMDSELSQENLSFFTIEMAILVFMMQCGFAFLEAGAVRSKNATNILIKNMVDCFVAVLSFWCLGWAFSFGHPSCAFSGYGEFLGIGLDRANYHRWFFQFMFAANAATIVSGSMAERSQFTVYIGVSALMSGFTYPVLAHWIWSADGWLRNGPAGVHFMDFAGSGAVHLHGGVTGLCGAAVLGPRLGAFVDGHRHADQMSGHSVPFASLGGWLLMFGFFGFNGGSVIGSGQGATVVALAVINTLISASAATIAMLAFTHFVLGRKYSLLRSINCALAGMVAACAGCDQLQPWASAVLGACASAACVGVVELMHSLRVDDPLDAVAVHAGGGLVGLLLSPLLGESGVLLTWQVRSFVVFAWNVMGTFMIIVWTVAIVLPLFLLMRRFNLLRVPEEVEKNGLDVYYHDESAYPLVAYGSGWTDDLLSTAGAKLTAGADAVNGPMALGSADYANAAPPSSTANWLSDFGVGGGGIGQPAAAASQTSRARLVGLGHALQAARAQMRLSEANNIRAAQQLGGVHVDLVPPPPQQVADGGLHVTIEPAPSSTRGTGGRSSATSGSGRSSEPAAFDMRAPTTFVDPSSGVRVYQSEGIVDDHVVKVRSALGEQSFDRMAEMFQRKISGVDPEQSGGTIVPAAEYAVPPLRSAGRAVFGMGAGSSSGGSLGTARSLSASTRSTLSSDGGPRRPKAGRSEETAADLVITDWRSKLNSELQDPEAVERRRRLAMLRGATEAATPSPSPATEYGAPPAAAASNDVDDGGGERDDTTAAPGDWQSALKAQLSHYESRREGGGRPSASVSSAGGKLTVL